MLVISDKPFGRTSSTSHDGSLQRGLDRGAARNRGDGAVALGRQRGGDVGVAAGSEGIAGAQIFREKSAVEGVAGSGRVDQLGRKRRQALAPFRGRDERAVRAEG